CSSDRPVFGLASVTTTRPIFTSQALGMTISALFKGLNGATVANPEVFLVQGPGPWCGTCTSARNVKGATGGTITGTSLGYVNYTRTEALVSLSQSFPLRFIPSDCRADRRCGRLEWQHAGRNGLDRYRDVQRHGGHTRRDRRTRRRDDRLRWRGSRLVRLRRVATRGDVRYADCGCESGRNLLHDH